MNAETIFGAAVTMGATWYLVCFIVRNTALEWYRQSMFQIRDQLFIDAVEGKNGLSLKDAAYRAVRDQLNARIRFANKVVPLTFAVFWLIPSVRSRLFAPSPIESQMAHSPASKLLQKVMREANFKTFEFFCYLSPVFWIGSSALFAVFRIVRTLKIVFAVQKVKMAQESLVAELQYSRSTLVGVTAGPRGGAIRACRSYDRLARDHDQLLLAA
jgi:hypothetical protein